MLADFNFFLMYYW